MPLITQIAGGLMSGPANDFFGKNNFIYTTWAERIIGGNGESGGPTAPRGGAPRSWGAEGRQGQGSSAAPGRDAVPAWRCERLVRSAGHSIRGAALRELPSSGPPTPTPPALMLVCQCREPHAGSCSQGIYSVRPERYRAMAHGTV